MAVAMTSLLNTFRQNEARKFFAWAVLLAYLFRAVIPVGYMPDMDALQKGVFKITICTMQGAQSLMVGDDGQPVGKDQGQHKKASDGFCPFGWAPKIALETLFLHVPVAAFAFALFIPVAPGILTSRALYSPAQPRAPPAF